MNASAYQRAIHTRVLPNSLRGSSGPPPTLPLALLKQVCVPGSSYYIRCWSFLFRRFPLLYCPRECWYCGGHSKEDQILLVKIDKYRGFCANSRSYLLWPPVVVRPCCEVQRSLFAVTGRWSHDTRVLTCYRKYNISIYKGHNSIVGSSHHIILL